MNATGQAAIACALLAAGQVCAGTGGARHRLETGAREVHGRLEHGLMDSVEWVDRFFGGEREEEITEQSRVRVFTDVVWGRGGEWDVAGSARATLELPRTERRLHLMVRSFENLAGDETGEDKDEDGGIRGSFAGLRTTVLEKAETVISLRGGTRMSLSLRPVFGLYARHRREVDPWLFSVSQSVYWRYTEGFGETTRVEVARALGTAWIGRSTSDAVWSETSAGVDLSQRFSFARPLGPRHAVAVEFGGTAYTRPAYRVSRGYGRLRLRRRLRWDAWALEVMPEAVFPEEREYRFTPQCTFRVEVLFEAQRGADGIR